MKFPLVSMFSILRKHHVNIGPRELLEAVEALRHHHVAASRSELVSMLQTMWATSREDAELIARVAHSALPNEFTPQQLQQLEQQLDEPEEKPERSPPVEDKKRSQEAGPEKREGPETDRGRRQPERPELVEFSVPDPDMQQGISVSGPSTAAHEMRQAYDLTGDTRVTRRHVKRSWRYFRKFRRTGRKAELDVAGTINSIARFGEVAEPVLRPRRINCAKILLLIDQGGSMMPFCEAVNDLVESAQQSGFSRLEVVYFHDTPGEICFRDVHLSEIVEVTPIIEQFADSGVLLVSDAGAARRRLDSRRIEATTQFLDHAVRSCPRIAWLNPVPQPRWLGTTAESIAAHPTVKMFSMDRTGLDNAVHFVRGHAK